MIQDLLKKDRRSFLFCSLVSLFLLWQCTSDGQPQQLEANTHSPVPTSDTVNIPGKELAEKYCQSCHLFPTPDQLDKTTWTENVLPNMAARLGLSYRDYAPFEGLGATEIANLKSLNVYPEQSILSEEEWIEIVKYYEELAPAQLPAQDRSSPTSPAPPPFTPNLVEIGDKLVPQVTLLKYDEANKTLFISDNLNLYALDQQGNFVGNWQIQSPSSDIAVTERGIFLLSIGQFKPSDQKEGVFFPLTLQNEQNAEDYVITDLPRPVQLAVGDLNEDEKEDVLICGFGNHQGQLAWYDQFQKDKGHVLSNLPGARKALIQDLNGDGRNDIMVLMAQAWEKLVIYYNQGNGKFTEETVLDLPAIYGSSYFELADFNQDGHPDILLTNGDNWDYSNVQKPYHGLRIYLNDGNNHFTLAYFYPMYGCSEARAVDFDQDGDLDIAAIAFYDDRPTQPDESFVYLENKGDVNFTAAYMNETSCGKWLTMDTGDFNNDGYPDIFLGSYFHNINELTKVMQEGVETFPEVLLLTYQQ